MTDRDDYGHAEYVKKLEKRQAQAKRRVEIGTKRAVKAGEKLWARLEASGATPPILQRAEFLVEFLERALYPRRGYPRAKGIESITPTFDWNGTELTMRLTVDSSASQGRAAIGDHIVTRLVFVFGPEEVEIDGHVQMVSVPRSDAIRFKVDHHMALGVPNKLVDSKWFDKAFAMAVDLAETVGWRELGLDVPTPAFDPFTLFGKAAEGIEASSIFDSDRPAEGQVPEGGYPLEEMIEASRLFLLSPPDHENDGCATCNLRTVLEKLHAWTLGTGGVGWAGDVPEA